MASMWMKMSKRADPQSSPPHPHQSPMPFPPAAHPHPHALQANPAHRLRQPAPSSSDLPLFFSLCCLSLSFLRRLLLVALRSESALAILLWTAPSVLHSLDPLARPLCWAVFAYGCSFRDVTNGALLVTFLWSLSTFVSAWLQNEVDRRRDPEFWRANDDDQLGLQPRLLVRWMQLSLTRRSFFAIRQISTRTEAEALDTALTEFLQSPDGDVDRLFAFLQTYSFKI